MQLRPPVLLAVTMLLAGCGSSAVTLTPTAIAVDIPTISVPTLAPIPTVDTFTGVQPPGPEFGQRQRPAPLPAAAATVATAAEQPEAPVQAAAATAQQPVPTPPVAAEGAAGTTTFPLTADAADVRDLVGNGTMANYTTKLSAAEIMDFYREALGKDGAVERELLTVQTGDVFSMVFDGWPAANGQAVVIQGTPIQPGTMNVNIRFEAV